jgi:hypothetical protein
MIAYPPRPSRKGNVLLHPDCRLLGDYLTDTMELLRHSQCGDVIDVRACKESCVTVWDRLVF